MSQVDLMFKISNEESKQVKVQLGWKSVTLDTSNDEQSTADVNLLQFIKEEHGRANSLPEESSVVNEWQSYLDTNNSRASSIGAPDEVQITKDLKQEISNSNGLNNTPKGRGLLGSSRREYLRRSGKFTPDTDESIKDFSNRPRSGKPPESNRNSSPYGSLQAAQNHVQWMSTSPTRRSSLIEVNRSELSSKPKGIEKLNFETASEDENIAITICYTLDSKSADDVIRTFLFPRNCNAKTAINSIIAKTPAVEGLVIADMVLSVPKGICDFYSYGHLLQPDELLVDFYNKGITWLKLRPHTLNIKAYLPEHRIEKSVHVDLFWTGKVAFQNMIKSFGELASTYTSETHALLIVPFSHLKGGNYSLWIKEEDQLSSYDVVNQSCIHFAKKEWNIKVALKDQFNTTRKLKVNPYSRVFEALDYIIECMGQRSSRSFKNAKSTYRNEFAILLAVNQTQRYHPMESGFYLVGKWMQKDDFLLYYYNMYDGLLNDTFELRYVTNRNYAIQFPDGSTHHIMVQENDKVAKILDELCNAVKLTKRQNFALEMTLPDGSTRWMRKDLTLAEQGVTYTTILNFKNRFLLSNQHLEIGDELAIHFTYSQASALVNAGLLQVAPKILMMLWALQMQVFFGDHKSDVHKPGFLQAYTSIFPPSALASEQYILEKHKKRAGLTVEMSKLKYIQLLQSPLTIDDPMFKSGTAIYGRYECQAKGLGSDPIDMLMKTKVVVELDFEKKSIVINNPQKSTNVLYLRGEELTTGEFLSYQSNLEDLLSIEKSLEDPKTLTFSGFLDKSVRRRKSAGKQLLFLNIVDITFKSNAERDLCFLSLHSIKGSPVKIPIRIFVGTFNIGGAALSSLDDFIPRNPNADLLVIGVQECKWKKTFEGEDNYWSSVFQKHIGTQFEVLADVQMWEIGLLVMVNSKYKQNITNLETANKPTGFANICGNKGGVGVAFRFNDTSFCFINSHLPARAERIVNRNEDFSALCEQLNLGQKKVDLVNQFDHLIWLGDLNYRIDLERHKIVKMITTQHWDALLAADQLNKEKNGKRTFCDFSEGRITFLPTYRYERGSQTEWSKKKLQNVPSYCDRILWRTLPPNQLVQHEYRCVNAITTSDHKPVYSTFTTEVRLPDEKFGDDLFCNIYIFLYDLEVTKVNEANFPVKNKQQSTDLLVLKAPFLEGSSIQVNLTKITDSLWKSKQSVDTIGPLTTLRSSLPMERIIIQFVCDANISGTTTVSLDEAATKNTPLELVCKLSHRGLHWGYLTGYIHCTFIKTGH